MNLLNKIVSFSQNFYAFIANSPSWLLLSVFIAILLFLFLLTRRRDDPNFFEKKNSDIFAIENIASGSLCGGESKVFKVRKKIYEGYNYTINVRENRPADMLTIATEFELSIYIRGGSKIADHIGNSGPICHFGVGSGKPLNINVLVARKKDNNLSSDKIDYKVTIRGLRRK